MKYKKYKNSKIHAILAILCVVLFLGCSDQETDNNELLQIIKDKETDQELGKSNEIAIEPPPFTDGIFPCSDCHADMEINPTRRELIDMHDDIEAIFDHDSENRWCLDCHDLYTRDSLKLANGELLDFKESYKLCGQCHGDKLRDWKVGVHGQRTGEWNGRKQYLLCVHCHNPHSPKFEPIKPSPPPVRQEDIY